MRCKLICDECGRDIPTHDYFCCHECLVRAIKNESPARKEMREMKEKAEEWLRKNEK